MLRIILISIVLLSLTLIGCAEEVGILPVEEPERPIEEPTLEELVIANCYAVSGAGRMYHTIFQICKGCD